MEDNLRSLSNQILHAQEEERKRISRELHDEVGQSLTAISMTLARLKAADEAGPAALGQKIVEAQRLLESTMETVHDFARELRPAMLDELGLLPALRSYLKDFAARTGLRVRFRCHPVAETLDGEQKTVLFRVAQESLNNVAKHAHATRVNVVLRQLPDAVCMEVADDGRSFREGQRNRARARKRLGLLGMQERLRLVNGRFAIQPRPGKGTKVRVLIPSPANGSAPARG
jgi:signal transduction histidine kinase